MNDGDAATSSTPIELFFDLVFVFTITQLTSGVVAHPNPAGVARATLILGNLWWMYGGYVWLTNTVTPRGDRERLALLVAMGGFLLTALAIPEGFGTAGILLGVGYLVVNAVHAWLLLGPIEGSIMRAMGRLGPFNMATAALILLAGFTHGAATWAMWCAAFVLHWATPYLTNPTVIALRSAHFVERHGLVVLIALGESIVRTAATVERAGLSGERLTAALAGLAIAAGLWWMYFDHDDEAAVEALEAATGAERSWMALHAFGYTFIPLLGAIIVFAAGLEVGVAEPGRRARLSTALLTAGGISVYALSLALIRRRLDLGSVTSRLGVVALAWPTALLGIHVSTLAELVALSVLLAAANVRDRRVAGAARVASRGGV